MRCLEDTYIRNYRKISRLPLASWLKRNARFQAEKPLQQTARGSSQSLLMPCNRWANLWSGARYGAPCRYAYGIESLFLTAPDALSASSLQCSRSGSGDISPAAGRRRVLHIRNDRPRVPLSATALMRSHSGAPETGRKCGTSYAVARLARGLRRCGTRRKASNTATIAA
jgi:hypothetical protein